VQGGVIVVCTTRDLDIKASGSADAGFCGALGFDGRVIFRLTEPEEDGMTREPVGLSPDGAEALFALTKPRRNSSDREVVGYRLWRRGRHAEFLPPDGPRVRGILEKYEGTLILPAPREGN
jgi:hypothetical protein